MVSRTSLVFLIVLFVSSCANPEDKITNTVLDYFQAESNEDYRRTAELTNPHQLEQLKNGVLPLLLRARSSNKAGLRNVADQFFEGVEPDKHSKLDKIEVYARLSGFMNKYKNNYINFVRTASVEIKDINGKTKESAEVEVILKSEDRRVPITVQLHLIDGNWYIQMANSPELVVN